MTREEFIEKMDKVFSDINEGQCSCLVLNGHLSLQARIHYNKEFRLNNSCHWVADYLGLKSGWRNDTSENRIKKN